jgi:hypothetical protein
VTLLSLSEATDADLKSLLPNWRRQQIIRRLEHFVAKALTDPIFRRRLRYHPQQALLAHGFEIEETPAQLGIKHYQVDVLINSAQLFGLQSSIYESVPLDLRLVAYGVKPIALIHGPEYELTGLVEWAEQRGFTALLSPQEWQPLADLGKGGYCNRTGTRQRAQAGSGRWRSLLVGWDEDHCLLAWLCLLFDWDKFLGRLLGYPDCCADAFRERWPRALEQHQGDLTVFTANASGPGPFDWRCNNLGRYFGFELIQHFPCQFNCPETLRLAENYADALGYYEPENLENLLSCLQAPVLYTEHDGVIIFTQAQTQYTEQGSELNYDPNACLVTQADSSITQTILQATQLTADNLERSIRINGKALANCYLIEFSQRSVIHN